jgi:hypothetical protein
MAKKETISIPFEFCITCGKEGDLLTYQFEYIESGRSGKLAFILGIVLSGIDLIIGWLFKRKYIILAMFCERCGAHLLRLGQYNLLFALAAVSAVVGFGAAGAFTSIAGGGFEWGFAIFVFGIFAAFGVVIYRKFYILKRAPRIKKISASEVLLNIPGKGEISLDRANTKA